ncbi:gamma subclass chorismate mutase AroQ [Streptomyces sp. NPDC006365]|uniref:gamma subclass chorismate mutase AroQ n=1 Tax=Streptomyces sp. NPDC006365 TaxID=3364744 RepID=UPI0036BBA0BD
MRERQVQMSIENSFTKSVYAGLATLMVAGLSSVGVTPATAASARVLPKSELTSLVDLAAERILLADKVAAAKFGTTVPIEDPVREQQVLDQAAALAADAGIDPEGTADFFRAQIEMSKFVQQGLHDLWTEHPELAPVERPDLATEVRPALDRITVEFIDQLVRTEDLRGSTLRCKASLILAKEQVNRRYDLDRLHGRALRGAIEPVCT